LFNLIGNFRKYVTKVCTELIDELCLPIEKRKDEPLKGIKNFFDGDLYIKSNLVIKLAWTRLELNSIPRENPFKMQPSLFEEKIYNDQYIKALGHGKPID
jgi:hypothetical protein